MNIRTETGNSHDQPRKYGCPNCGKPLHIPNKVPFMGTCGGCKKIWKRDNIIKLEEDETKNSD